jgi:antirestriction protein ArdC
MTFKTNSTNQTIQAQHQKGATKDIYSRITDKIIADLEKGELPWRKPWNAKHLAGHVNLPLRANDSPYQGINVLLLWAAAAEKGYVLPRWVTFNQAIQWGGTVRKGEKGTQIVYADKVVKSEPDDEGKEKIKSYPFLKAYWVFNVDQIESLPSHMYTAPVPAYDINPDRRNHVLEAFFLATKADIYTGTKASYNQQTDRIQMPPFESFRSAKVFYSTQAHELVHWTKHPMRLNRDMGRSRFGDEGYAKEELVAELGACFLAADLGIEPLPEEQHAAYIQSWLKALHDDKRLIIQAASHAQRAAEYVHSLQPQTLP